MIDPVERDLANHINRLTQEANAHDAAEHCVNEVIDALVDDKTAVVASECNHLGDEKHVHYNLLDALDWLEESVTDMDIHELIQRVKNDGGVEALSRDERCRLAERWADGYDLLGSIQNFQDNGGGYISLIK